MTRALRLVLLLAPLLLASGCVIVEEDPDKELPSPRWTGPPPGPQQVRQAAAWLDDAIGRRFKKGRWPAHLARSRDFPDLPLVELKPVEDRGAWGVDTDALTKTLEQSLREHFSLRFLADELAVPDFLRDAPGKEGEEQKTPAPPEGEPKPKPKAGLVLTAWAAEDGRFYLDLRDVANKTSLVTVRSQQPGGF